MVVTNVRRFLFGQSLSNIGTFFQIIAQALLVLELTGSGLALGLVSAAQFLPLLLFAPVAGVWIDRIRIPRLLSITASIAGLEALTLGILTATGQVTIGWIFGLTLVLGIAQVGDRAAGQAFLTELVGSELLPSAVGLAAVANSVGRLGGPAIAAALYAWQGPAACFFFNAASYLAVVVSIALLRRRELLPRTPQSRRPRQLRDGIIVAWRTPVLRRVLLANAVIGGFTFNFPAFYSSLCSLTFGAGAGAFGLAETLNAITAVAGGFLLARRFRKPTLGTYAAAAAALGASLLYSAVSPTLLVFLIGMPYFGLAVVSYQIVAQVIVQQHTPDGMHGRMMSLLNVGTQGVAAIGGVATGWLTDAISPRASLALGGLVPVLCALIVISTRTLGATHRGNEHAAVPV